MRAVIGGTAPALRGGASLGGIAPALRGGASFSVVIALGLGMAGVAGVASAQGAPPPAQPAPASPPVAQTQPPPPGTPEAQPQPAPAAPTAPAEPVEPGTTTTPPPPPPTYPTPETPGQEPPPPRYEPLGRPEPEVEKGDWDPWEHATPDKHRHDGFYLRLSIGIGGGSIAGDDHILTGVDEVTVKSVGLATSIGIGGALTDNLILNANLFQTMLFNPSVDIDGDDVGDADDLDFDIGVGDDAEIGGIGIGVTYYFMPVNIYLAGSVGIGQAVFEDGRGDREGSDIGLVLDAMVGKEWWVGTDWGLGVAGQFIYLRAEDDIFGDVNGIAVNVMFSATYN
jgi:hypothetical protein